jgi:hypothetical protein
MAKLNGRFDSNKCISFKPVIHLQDFSIAICFVILCVKQFALDMLLFMDEAWFHLNGYINNQNSRIWSDKNPHALHENPLHLSKICV